MPSSLVGARVGCEENDFMMIDETQNSLRYCVMSVHLCVCVNVSLNTYVMTLKREKRHGDRRSEVYRKFELQNAFMYY